MNRTLISPTPRAWLIAEGGVVLTATSANSTAAPLPWHSAVTRLITGVNATFGEERYRYLRRRIICDGEISIWNRNLVKVCAKRITDSRSKEGTNSNPDFFSVINEATRVIDVGIDLTCDPNSERCAESLGQKLTSCDAINLVAGMVARLAAGMASAEIDLHKKSDNQKQEKKHQIPRCVASLLVDGDGRLLGANVNTNVGFQLRHAEVNLLVSLAERGFTQIPPGATLYTSLKPCRMCASLILALSPTEASASKSPTKNLPYQVIALSDDPGPHGRHQMLGSSLMLASI